jgi:hypothetical protein
MTGITPGTLSILLQVGAQLAAIHMLQQAAPFCLFARMRVKASCKVMIILSSTGKHLEENYFLFLCESAQRTAWKAHRAFTELVEEVQLYF